MLKFQIISFSLFSFQEFVSYINVSYSVLLYGAVYFMCVIIGDNSPADMPPVPSIHLLSPLVFVLPLLHSSLPSIVSYIIFCALSTSYLCALFLLSFSPAPLWPMGPSALSLCRVRSFRPGTTRGLVLSPSLSLAYLFPSLLK